MKCNECHYNYEITEKPSDTTDDNWDGSCGCEALEKYGICPYADQDNEE